MADNPYARFANADNPYARFLVSRQPDALDNPNMANEGGINFRPFGIDTGLKMPQGVSRVLAGTGKAAVDRVRGIGQLVGLTSQESIDEAKNRDKALGNTWQGTLGNILGEVAMTAPAMAIPGVNSLVGATALGGVLGGTAPVASDESRLTNAALSGVGGLAGQAVANTVGRAIRPVQSQLNPELSRLADVARSQDIPLNVAQQTGSRPLTAINAVLDNLPFTADRQAADKALQRSAFNRAVLRTVGENSDTATPDVLNAARNRIGQQFQDLSARNSVALGDDFINALTQVEAGTNAFTNPGVRQAVDKALELASMGKLDGRTYQNVRSTLGKQAKDAFNSGRSEVGQALKTIQTALDDAASASIAPADKAAWTQARKQWQALKAVEKAAAPNSADAVAGNISPAKLANAVQTGNKNGMVYGTGDQTLPDLARIGQAFIKDQVPDSGTAQRTFYQTLLTGGAGLGGLLMANPIAAVGAAAAGSITPAVLQGLMRSPAGQRYLTQGLLSGAPEIVKQTGGLLGRAAPLAGAALLPAAYPQ